MIHGQDLPALNAALNATSGVLLIVGYSAIRQGAVKLHKTCMLTALVVSAVFLSSYLYYHFVVRNGRPTAYTHEGTIRLVYFAILISHTLLAVTVAPLAIITAYRGLANQLDKHVRIARWTLPIWLYVSVTGVIVYWMLYRV